MEGCLDMASPQADSPPQYSSIKNRNEWMRKPSQAFRSMVKRSNNQGKSKSVYVKTKNNYK